MPVTLAGSRPGGHWPWVQGDGIACPVTAQSSCSGGHQDRAGGAQGQGLQPSVTVTVAPGREQAGNAVRYFARQLEGQLESENLEKLSKSKKFAAKYAPREPAPAGDAPAGDPKTLHNGIVRAAPPVTDDLPEEDGARWREVKRRAGIR